MLLSVLILKQESGILLFEYHVKPPNYELGMFSGLLTAIQTFCLEMNIGDCDTFGSKEFQIITAKLNFVTVSLILKKKDNNTEDFWKHIALQIAELFEKNYDLTKFSGNIANFKNFKIQLVSLLNEKGII